MIEKINQKTWQQTLYSLKDWRLLRIGLLGFSSGLPLLLVFGTLSFWLREAGVERSTIGFISWIALAYAIKVFWSPLVDHFQLPFLFKIFGRRRSWLLFTQFLIIIGLIGMALSDPKEELSLVVWLALLVAFSSATQDIAVDAYRIEIADQRLQGMMASFYTTGYRLAMFVASAGALWIAAFVDFNENTYEQAPWMIAYMCMAMFMFIGIITTLFSPEPKVKVKILEFSSSSENNFLRFRKWFKNAVLMPFSDFFSRYGFLAILILSLIATYRISDIVLGVMSNVFYKDLGFSKDDIALVSKGFGIYMTILGALVGGLAVYKYGVMKILFLGAFLASGTNLLFSLLAYSGNNFWMLVAVVGADNLSAGIASAAFITYLSALTNISFSATQYALFSSLMLLLPKFFGGFSGIMVDEFGYELFFIISAAVGVPVLILILIASYKCDVELPKRKVTNSF